MQSRWINNQNRNSFSSFYEDIYDWKVTEYHHSRNWKVYAFILTLQSTEENQYGKSGHFEWDPPWLIVYRLTIRFCWFRTTEVNFKDNSPVTPHQIKINPKHCPPGPWSLGLFPTRTTPHWDHYHGIKPLMRTNTCTVGNCPGGELCWYGFGCGFETWS